MSGESSNPDAKAIEIPDGTQFVIIDFDTDNERVQVEFSVGGKVMRAWVPASSFAKLMMN